MRVVQINGVFNSGSTGKIVTQLSEVMRENDIESYIISSGYKEKEKPENVYFCSSKFGVRLHQFLGILFGNSGFHSPIATSKAIRFIKKMKPDIVHLHNVYSYYLNVEKLLKFLKKSGISVVWTMHDFWAITGHCTHFEAVGCDKWKTWCETALKEMHSHTVNFLTDLNHYIAGKGKFFKGGIICTLLPFPTG